MHEDISSNHFLLNRRLNNKSTPYLDPLNLVNWDCLSSDSYWLPESAISLYGTPYFDAFSCEQKIKLSHYEFINFVEAGLWLESLFMERISRNLRLNHFDIENACYHLHELREEAGHSLMFLELVKKSGISINNKHFRKINFANLFAKFAKFDSVLFWLAVYMGEDIPDKLNRYIRAHRTDVCPCIVDIINVHINDEARHIAHAKSKIFNDNHETPFRFNKLYCLGINKVFSNFVDAYYYPPNSLYYAAGLDKRNNWNKIVKNSESRTVFITNLTDQTRLTIQKNGVNILRTAG